MYPSQPRIFCLGLAQFPRWRYDPLRHLAVRHGLLPHLVQRHGRVGGRYVGLFLLERLILRASTQVAVKNFTPKQLPTAIKRAKRKEEEKEALKFREAADEKQKENFEEPSA
jgi:hypothetical protein